MKVRRASLILLAGTIAVLAGLLKIYLHFESKYRLGALDYLFATGVILGGIFLLLPRRVTTGNDFLMLSGAFVAFEVLKLVQDFPDRPDAALAVMGVAYLLVPWTPKLSQLGVRYHDGVALESGQARKHARRSWSPLSSTSPGRWEPGEEPLPAKPPGTLMGTGSRMELEMQKS